LFLIHPQPHFFLPTHLEQQHRWTSARRADSPTTYTEGCRNRHAPFESTPRMFRGCGGSLQRGSGGEVASHGGHAERKTHDIRFNTHARTHAPLFGVLSGDSHPRHTRSLICNVTVRRCVVDSHARWPPNGVAHLVLCHGGQL
jgi:hypothetical protein